MAISRNDDADLGGLGVFWSGRWVEFSFIVCECSMRGRTLGPVRDSGEVRIPDSMLALFEGMADIPAWTALSGDDEPL